MESRRERRPQLQPKIVRLATFQIVNLSRRVSVLTAMTMEKTQRALRSQSLFSVASLKVLAEIAVKQELEAKIAILMKTVFCFVLPCFPNRRRLVRGAEERAGQVERQEAGCLCNTTRTMLAN
jgi:hypothetical protein